MRALVLCVVAATGCGRLRFDERLDDGAARPADTIGTGPFGTPMEVGVINSGMIDDDPTLTADQLEIFFNSDRSGTFEIWRATRERTTDPWQLPTRVPELTIDGVNANTPEVSSDGLTIYIASNRSGAGDLQYVATRASRTATWSTPVEVPELNIEGSNVAVSLLPGDTKLYMGVALADFDIFTASRSSPSVPWSTPAAVPELVHMAFDSDPAIEANDLTIYWASRRDATELNLWSATRSSVADPFAQPAPVAELNTIGDEDDPWISPDGHTLYFARGADVTTQMSIYVVTR